MVTAEEMETVLGLLDANAPELIPEDVAERMDDNQRQMVVGYVLGKGTVVGVPAMTLNCIGNLISAVMSNPQHAFVMQTGGVDAMAWYDNAVAVLERLQAALEVEGIDLSTPPMEW